MKQTRFTGTLAKTQTRHNSSSGKPLTQALFHSKDTDSIVAVWHDTPPPVDLTIGETYKINGHMMQHNGRIFVFRPSASLVVRLRHILLRPRDWSRVSRAITVAGSVSAALLVLLGMNYAANHDSRPRETPSATAAYHSPGSNGKVPLGAAGTGVTNTNNNASPPKTSEPAAVPKPNTTQPNKPITPVVNIADCVLQAIPFKTSTQPDGNLLSGVQHILKPGEDGTKKVCHPNGRSNPAVTTVVKKPVDQIVSLGTLLQPKDSGSGGDSTDGSSSENEDDGTTPAPQTDTVLPKAAPAP